MMNFITCIFYISIEYYISSESLGRPFPLKGKREKSSEKNRKQEVSKSLNYELKEMKFSVLFIVSLWGLQCIIGIWGIEDSTMK